MRRKRFDLEDEEENIDLLWREGRVEVDTRMSRPHEAFQDSTSLHLPSKEYASPAKYFLRFLPETHIREVVIPTINEHALTVIPTFNRVTYDEYLVWIALFVMMTIAPHQWIIKRTLLAYS